MAEKQVSIWYDREGDFLEVTWGSKGGYFTDTKDDRVMVEIDDEGNISGFHILAVSTMMKPVSLTLNDKPLPNEETSKWASMTREQEIMDFLHLNVFDPILESERASNTLKNGVRLTINRMSRLNAAGMVKYYWSAISGTDRSIDFARQMEAEGFTRFEEVIDEFRGRFDDRWLNS